MVGATSGSITPRDRMKITRFALSVFALISTGVLAGPANMVAQCEAVMRCDVCRIANDTHARPNGVLVSIQGANGPEVRRISSAGYEWLRNAGSEKVDGRYVMCMRVEQAMTEPAASEHNFVARSLFDANWKQQDYCPR